MVYYCFWHSKTVSWIKINEKSIMLFANVVITLIEWIAILKIIIISYGIDKVIYAFTNTGPK